MRFIFVRHGKTHFNELNLTQGWCDSPLSKDGRKQVEGLKSKLKDTKIDAAYSSTLGRAVETAEILIQGRKIELIQDKRLKEINFGIMEGISQDLVQKLQIESRDWLNDMCMDYRPYEGEEIHEVIKRQERFLEDIKERHEQDETILIVGHGCSLYSFLKESLIRDQKFDF
ncbi:MAG: histidine phosphatase family protein [Anaerostipes sp.]